MSTICYYCEFKKGCIDLKNDSVEDCLLWREENAYDNGYGEDL